MALWTGCDVRPGRNGRKPLDHL